jgi:hypothetical protein
MFHGYRRFTAYKRHLTRGTTKLGIVSAENKVQADTKARYLYGRFLVDGEAIWTEELNDNEPEDYSASRQCACGC